MRRTCCPVFAGLALVLACSGVAYAATYNVKNYGAVGNGVTDDTNAIQSAINAAANAGSGNQVYLPSSTYYAGGGWNGGVIFHVPSNAVNLTITGDPSGTKLLTAGGRDPFFTDNCTNCTIQNMTVDYKTLNVTQGTITAINAGSKTATVTIDSGYAAPNSGTFTAASGYTPTFDVLSPGRNTFNWEEAPSISSVAASGSNWIVNLGSTPTSDYVGKRFFIWGKLQQPWTPFVTIQNNNGLTVQNVNDYAGGGFQVGGSTGTLTFSNFYSGPPPGTTRLGFYGGHQGHCRANIVMNNCQMLMSNDDDMNDLTGMDHVLAHPAANTVQVAPSSDYQVGDTVSIWDYTNANAPYVRQSATISSINTAGNGNTNLVLNANVTVVNAGAGQAVPNAWTDGIDRVVDLSSGGTVTLTNCAFNSSFAHPLLLKTATAIDIENCYIFGGDMSGLCSGMQTYWNEGPQCRNVTLKNNTISDIDGIACELGIETPNGISTSSHDQTNIDIENNVFRSGGNHNVWNGIMPRGVGLLIGNVSGAIVKNNLFDGFPNAAIAVYSSDNVQISGNIFANGHQTNPSSNNWTSSVNVNQGSTIWINNAGNVSLNNNVVYNDGAYGTTLVGLGSSLTNIKGANTGVSYGNGDVYYAAQGVLTDCQVRSGGGSAGGQYVGGIDASDSSVTFTVTVPQPGYYPVVVSYDNDSNIDQGGLPLTATHTVIVNGNTSSPVTVNYAFTGPWGTFSPVNAAIARVFLNSGSNTLKFQHATNRTELDNIVIPISQGASALNEYKLFNQNSSKVLAIVGAATGDGANVQQYSDNGTADHNWQFVYAGNGYYRLVNQNSGKELGVNGGSTAAGAQVIQWSTNGAADHLWKLTDIGGGYYKVINKNSGKLLEVVGSGTGDGVLVDQNNDSGGANQHWRLQDIRSGSTYRIANNYTTRVLTPTGGQTANGTALTQWDDNGTADHLWQLQDMGFGLYKFLNTNSGKEMGIVGGFLTGGTDAIIWEPNGAADHLWQLQDSGGSNFTLANWNSGLVLGVNGMNTANGAEIFQTPENFTADHIWSLR